MNYNSPEFVNIKTSIVNRKIPVIKKSKRKPSTLTPEILEELYLNRHLTYQQIGDFAGVSRQRICQLIKIYGIDTSTAVRFKVICPQCSKEFETVRSKYRIHVFHYCSQSCYTAHKKSVNDSYSPDRQAQLIARAVMSDHLQRPLTDSEVVHHEDGDQSNNDIENLILFVSQSEHSRYHHQKQLWSKNSEKLPALQKGTYE